MRIRLIPLSLLFFTFSFFACGDNGSEEGGGGSGSGLEKIVIGKTFVGVLPCASCPGIDKRLYLGLDHSARVETLYEDNDVFPDAITGTFEVRDSFIDLHFVSAADNQRYKIRSDTVLAFLGPLDETKETEGNLASAYWLHFVPPVSQEQVVGTYEHGGKGKGAYTDILRVSYEQDSARYVVEFSSQGAGKGCAFKGYAREVQGNRLFIPLASVHKEHKGTLTLTFEAGTVAVYVTNAADKEELRFFCGGGGSLLGSYKKKANKS